MKFYHLPDDSAAEINQLEKAVVEFKEGKIHPVKFRTIRVPFGVYEQRTENTFMMRIRCTGGGATPRQLTKVGELAKRYGKPVVHITTRQEMQLHDLELEDVPAIMRELLEVGLSSRGGGGNTVRNIMASYDSGINPAEAFDVGPHAIALGSRLIAETDSWNLPRKFKISFSSLETDNSLASVNDLGYIARIVDGVRGFRVLVAGGMGCRPRIAHLLHDFVDEDHVYHVCAALKRLFLKYGNRKNKNANRLRFLWDELGEAKFMDLYREEFDRIKDDSILRLELNRIENEPTASGISPINTCFKAFETWKSRYVSDQTQPGLRCIMIPVNLGDLNADDAARLGRLLEPFGENVLRFTMRQNIHIRNIPEEYLGHIYEGIQEMETLSHLPEVFGNMVACAGADTCTQGVCLSRGVAPILQKQLLGTPAIFDLPSDVAINISGCPNACGQHFVGDLGFFGRIARKNGRVYPAYWVLGGARASGADPRFADKAGWIPARKLPVVIQEILEAYRLKKNRFSSFAEYFDQGGQEEMAAICERSNGDVPSAEENGSYYFDWGATSTFSTTRMGHGECSAGIYDMIEVDMQTIKANRSRVESSKNQGETKTALWDMVLSASSMLLVTRGLDPTTNREIFQQYIKHFIDTRLIPETFREIVLAADKKDYPTLEKRKTEIFELGDGMIRLYHSMDNSLRFPGETDILDASSIAVCPAPGTTTPKKDETIRFKDFLGVACPMNFVKTKLELAKMDSQQRLEIWLDDGEPIDNVPRSVVSEGHRVVSKRKVGNHWSVVIEKA
ncbi:MAG: sulfite reductase subunit beta (hemoprotein) [Proteobacteria bacterium]|nr:sulfite reductase subunit beta (hemoprotein) [Pseudomonadota bacterium]